MRESVKTLIAFGTCAVYGGPSGIGWLSTPASVLQCVYGQGPTNAPKQMPDKDAPALEQGVTPIDEVVKVDFYVPGCPPHPFWIAAALQSLGEPNGKLLTEKAVCSRCERTMKKTSGVSLKKGAISASENDVCFLSQGVVCLGSVTLERCLAQCPNRGIACSGCAGPSADIITEPHLDIRTMVAKRMHLLTGIDKDEIYRKVNYSYSMSRMQLEGYVLNQKLKVWPMLNASLINLTRDELKQYNYISGDSEGFVNKPLQIQGMRLSCFLREDKDIVKVSLRSIGDFPCNEMAAQFFNGGGHKNASGGEYHGTMDEAIAQYEKAINAFKKQLMN